MGTLATLKQINGPLVLTRYNMYPAAPINGAAAAGVSSGEAIATMEALGKQELLGSMTTEWTELAFLELQAGNTAIIVFGFAVVMVFLVLAAQYESWSLPLAIILVVPMCLLSAVVGVNVAGQDINIFTQIGFVVLVGSGEQERDPDRRVRQAAPRCGGFAVRVDDGGVLAPAPADHHDLVRVHPRRAAAADRPRAGAEMRRTLGTTVFSGMLGVTLFGIFLTPTFFFVIDWLGETRFFSNPAVRRPCGSPLVAARGPAGSATSGSRRVAVPASAGPPINSTPVPTATPNWSWKRSRVAAVMPQWRTSKRPMRD